MLTLSLRSFVGHSQPQICGQFPLAENANALTHRFEPLSVLINFNWYIGIIFCFRCA